MCASARIHAAVPVVPIALLSVVVAIVVAEVVPQIVCISHFAGVERVDASQTCVPVLTTFIALARFKAAISTCG